MQEYRVGQAPSVFTAMSTKVEPTDQKATIGATGQTILFDGVLTDPAVVTLRVEDPVGNIVTYTFGQGAVIVRDSVGLYYAYVPITLPGTWGYDWAGDPNTNVAKLGSGKFTAVPAPF